jgi:hypothetical protein
MPNLIASNDVGSPCRKGLKALPIQHRPALFKDLRRCHFTELFEAKYGLKKQDMVKMNIKGAFQIWMKDGSYHEIDLKECHRLDAKGLHPLP